MRGIWATASTMALALAMAAAPAGAQIAQVDVTGGRIAGSIIDGLSEFKGIPFAAPPLADLRWRAPQPLKPWAGVRQSTTFGPACMQNPTALSRQAPGISQSEDCLYLDIWSPAKSSHERLPVIAWIYGRLQRRHDQRAAL